MANKLTYRTEDEVRDSAKVILGFDKSEPKVKQGTGQITTFNQLGFKGVIDKPDGWYLPDDKGIPAIILETKSESEDISLKKWEKELIKNCKIVLTKYKHVAGILYNGNDVRVFLDNIEAETSRNILKFGRSIERLDLYTRLDYPIEMMRKEFSIMLNRLYKVGIDFNSHSIERLTRMILEEDDYKPYRISIQNELCQLFVTGVM